MASKAKTNKPTEKKIVAALKQHLDREAKIHALMQEHGIYDLQEESAALKAAATQWAVELGVERVEIDDAHHATLIKQFYDSRFIGTKDDVRGDEGRKVVPLKTILRKKLGKSLGQEVWMRVTRRVVDRDLLEEVIGEEVISVDDVSPAFVEKEKKPYLRIFVDE